MRKLFILAMLITFLFSCASENIRKPADISMQKHYNQWVDSCNSYKDVGNYLQNFYYDMNKNKKEYKLVYSGKFKRSANNLQSPWYTFTTMTGVCGDASVLAKYSLNKINPNYKAEIIFVKSVIDGQNRGHYVTGFYLDDLLYVMDYGTPYEEIKGTHGPFNSLEEYGQFALQQYEKAMDKNITLKKIKWGWLTHHYTKQNWRDYMR